MNLNRYDNAEVLEHIQEPGKSLYTERSVIQFPILGYGIFLINTSYLSSNSCECEKHKNSFKRKCFNI